jgi:hypothetical protein
MKLLASSMTLIALLPSCSDQARHSPRSEQAADEMLQKWEDKDSIGRFQFYAANGEMPALIFDTATGCMEIIERFAVENNQRRTVWVRAVSDEVAEGTPKRCRPAEGTKK